MVLTEPKQQGAVQLNHRKRQPQHRVQIGISRAEVIQAELDSGPLQLLNTPLQIVCILCCGAFRHLKLEPGRREARFPNDCEQLVTIARVRQFLGGEVDLNVLNGRKNLLMILRKLADFTKLPRHNLRQESGAACQANKQFRGNPSQFGMLKAAKRL